MTTEIDPQPTGAAARVWSAYRMRWKRRRLLFRAVRKRGQLRPLADRTDQIGPSDILAASVVRNEATRLPFWLAHNRALGVKHFLIVDNDSDDGTTDLLLDQPDVSLWTTRHSYKLARFGMDWLTLLMIRHANDHWCLTTDADELLIYPDWKQRRLAELTAWLDRAGRQSFGALMLDMYPRQALSEVSYKPGDDPIETIPWFDAENYLYKYQPDLQNLLIRGGVRYRRFFSSLPDRAPTLSKAPLVRWNRRFAYVSSTHSLLPRRLNAVRGDAAGDAPTGVLLHTKFLPEIVRKSAQEKYRGEHFENSDLYQGYYDALADSPTLWGEKSIKFNDWRQLVDLGLMQSGSWGDGQTQGQSSVK